MYDIRVRIADKDGMWGISTIRSGDSVYSCNGKVIQIRDDVSDKMFASIETEPPFFSFNCPALPFKEDVYISDTSSLFDTKNNPRYTKGKITNFETRFLEKDRFFIKVLWENGSKDIYRLSDLVDKKRHFEQNLEKVRAEYPPGTKFKCLHNCAGGPVNDPSEFSYDSIGVIRWIGKNCGVGCVYDPNGKKRFAEIINQDASLKAIIPRKEDDDIDPINGRVWDDLLRTDIRIDEGQPKELSKHSEYHGEINPFETFKEIGTYPANPERLFKLEQAFDKPVITTDYKKKTNKIIVI